MPENPIDMWEGAPLKIKEKPKHFHGSGIKRLITYDKVDLVFKKGDQELKREADFNLKSGEFKYDLPKVADDEPNYLLTVSAEYGGGKQYKRKITEVRVWPREVTVESKTKDGGVFKKFAFFIEQTGEKPVEGETDDAGTGKVQLKAMKPYALKAKAPFVLVENPPAAGKVRLHQPKVRKTIKAKILAPVVDADPFVANDGADRKNGVRQFVNMTTAKDGQDGLGSEMTFEVAAEPKADGKKGDEVYIEVKFSRASKRNDPEPALLADGVTDLKHADGKKTYTGKVELGADGGSATFKVRLGLAGGDTCTVKVGGSPDDVNDDKAILVNWRRLGYQLQYAAAMAGQLTELAKPDGSKYKDFPAAVKAAFDARLGQGFIEYVHLKSHELANPPAATLIKESFLKTGGDAAKDVFTLTNGWMDTTQGFDPKTDDREIHVFMCSRAFSNNGAEENPAFTLKAAETTVKWNNDNKFYYFEKSPKDGSPNVKVAGLTWQAKMDLVPDAKKMFKPAMEFESSTRPDSAGAVANTFRVEEMLQSLPAVQVQFENGQFKAGQEAALKAYVNQAFLDHPALRRNGNKIRFKIYGPHGAVSDIGAFQRVVEAVQDAYDANNTKVLFHPGVNEDGTPRSGPMSDVEVSLVDRARVKIKPPLRQNPGDPAGPGDLAGEPSETKCPVGVSFKLVNSWSINGNSGSGYQLMVLEEGKIAGAVAATVCHELGHNMGMSIMVRNGSSKNPHPPGMDEPKHVDNGGPYYIDHDTVHTNGQRKLHKGPHCSTGMPEAKRTQVPAFGGWSPGATEVCIMWGSGGNVDNRKNFCPVCLGYLKGRRLENVRTSYAGRAANMG